jgi:hypothetical protein
MTDTPEPTGGRLGRSRRALLLSWGLCLAAGFALAASVEPDPRGFGTHQRLGLPPCTFHVLTGLPCPGCGLTTSISHFVRGEFAGSIRANLAGFVLAMACAVQIPWALHAAWTGRPWGAGQYPPGMLVVWTLGVVTVLAMAQWVVRVLAG